MCRRRASHACNASRSRHPCPTVGGRATVLATREVSLVTLLLLSGCPIDGTGLGDTPDTSGETGADSGDDNGFHCDVAEDGSATYAQIQDAVDASTDGDTIRVCPGTYGAVELRGRAVTLLGADRATTFIRGTTSAAALSVQSGTVSVDGFTLAGSSTLTGGAFDMTEGVATLTNMRVTASGGPVGFWQHDGDLSCDHVDVEDNLGDGTNSVLAIGPDARTEWAHSWFRDNSNASFLMGVQGAISLHNNIFAHNSFVAAGVSISSWENGGQVTRADNNVFYDNRSMLEDGNRWVLSVSGSGALAQGNIVQGSNVEAMSSGSSGDASWNLVFDVEAGDAPSGTGNLSVDARFTNPDADDFTLDSLSPAIDAGNPEDAYNDADDSRNDIGAWGGPGGAGW